MQESESSQTIQATSNGVDTNDNVHSSSEPVLIIPIDNVQSIADKNVQYQDKPMNLSMKDNNQTIASSI